MTCAAVLVLAAACSSRDSADIAGRWVPDTVPSAELGADFQPADAVIEFDEDGRWTASDGCNELGGTYSLDGDRFRAKSPGGLGGVGCLDGEVRYDVLLSDVRTVTAADGRLEFLDEGGELVLRLRPE